MNKIKLIVMGILIVGAGFVISGCTKKTTNTTNTNTPVVVTEAPFVLENGSKVFTLKLVNGLLNYKTMTFHAGDRVEVRLTSDDQPINFKFQEVPAAASTNGVFGTILQDNDQGGTYHLICSDRECGSITLTVIPKAGTNTSANNTNQASNTNTGANINSTNQITKVELQRIPEGTGFTPTGTYETTTSFHVGDQFGLSVTGDFIVGTKFAHAITDSSGKSVEAQTAHSDLRAGTNGSCCYSLPTSAGSYNVKLYINGTEAQSVPITMESKSL